jgi:hypothetical protein
MTLGVRMTRTVLRRVTGVFAAALVGLWASAHQVESQRPRHIDLSVVDPRPLAAAILELEKRFEWVITYEDPPYEWAVDVGRDTGRLEISQPCEPCVGPSIEGLCVQLSGNGRFEARCSSARNCS